MGRTGSGRLLAILCCVGIACVSEARGQGATTGQSGHDREYWRQIAKNHYAVPPGQDAFSLARELSGYLGSPDPELRDDLA